MIRVGDIKTIQELRALQVISDLDFTLAVNKRESNKLEVLKKIFGLNYIISNDEFESSITKIIKTNHEKPVTSILSISKPLIFSKKIPLLLKNKWVKKKKYKFSFCGLITKNRKITIEKWLNSEINYSQEISINSFYNKIKKKVSNYIFHEMLFINYYGDLAVWSSSRGRKFPIKSWDMEYFNFMLKSEYVLCPSGDYVWTYRFFEAVMCGAIPIVEQSCDIYDGFKFYRMSDSRLSYTYNNDIIEYNFNLLLDRITLSDSEINLLKRQLNKLLKS